VSLRSNLPSALVRGTHLELGQKVGANTLFAFKLRDGSASSELDRVVLDPRAAAVGNISEEVENEKQEFVLPHAQQVAVTRKESVIRTSSSCCHPGRVDEPWKAGFVQLPSRFEGRQPRSKPRKRQQRRTSWLLIKEEDG
jgi:hypothetical protein